MAINDPYERRRTLLKNQEDLTKEDINTLTERNTPDREYGELETYEIEKISEKHIYTENKDGRIIRILDKEGTIPYWVTESWCGPGIGVRVKEAYRIDSEDGEVLRVRKVKDLSELEEIAEALKENMKKILQGK